MAWVAKDHSAHPVPTPCYVQGRQPAAQAAQSHIQPGLECLQGWGIHSLLGQPVQCVTTLWVKNFLLISSLNLPCLSLKPFPLSPSTDSVVVAGLLPDSSGSVLFTGSLYRCVWMRRHGPSQATIYTSPACGFRAGCSCGLKDNQAAKEQSSPLYV